MKRTITSIAAASMALGMLVPVAFASSTTTSWTHKVAGQLPIVVNGTATSNPFELTAVDSGNTTAYFPMFYFNQALNSLGYTATWDGVNHVWNISAPSVDASQISITGGVGTGNTSISVNGTVVKKINTYAAKDPAASKTAAPTSYFPAFYINEIFNGLGAKVSFSGQTGLSITKASATTGTGMLSNIAVTGATAGDGSLSNPAVSLNSAATTLSTTLTDANGNALTNTAVTFNVSNYGNYPTNGLPTVENASGTVVSGTAQSNAEQYTVYTDSTGAASISLTNPSGTTNAYEVVATAPYSSASSTAVSSQPAYVEFVSNNTPGITPYAASSNPFSASIGAPVPVSVILPPNAAGQTQANVLVTLTVTTPAGAQSHASFVNSTGTVLGAQIQVTTNSSGIAQAYLSDSFGETVEVQATNLPSGLNNPDPTYISFAQAGIPAKISNISVSTNAPNIGQNVVVSGQLQDASGNPVANGQVLVTSPNTGSNDFAYVNSDSTTTTFPLISSVSVGTPATSAYGDLVTADAAGNFNFSVTDPRVESQSFYIYPVANGEVQSATPLNGTTPSNSNTVAFVQSTTLSILSIGANDSYIGSNSSKTLTGLSSMADAGGIAGNGLGADNGTSNQIAQVYVEPQNSAGHHTGGALDNTSLSYSLSADNGGLIYSINGVSLSSPAAGVNLTYTPATASAAAYFTANGTTIPVLSGAVHVSDFEAGVINSNTGATNFTVASGSVSSTATITFGGGTPDQVANFTPGAATINAGQTQQVSFQLQDTNGNPAPNTQAEIETDQDNGNQLWITQVNGAALQESLNLGTAGQASYSTVATPIPLGDTPVNYDVSIPGVANWTHGVANPIYINSDANGNVSFTVQASGLSYPTQQAGVNPGIVSTPALPATGGAVKFWTDTNGDNGSVPLFIGTNGETPSAYAATHPTFKNASAFSIEGSVTWGTGATTQPSNSGVVTSGAVTTKYVAGMASTGYVSYVSPTATSGLAGVPATVTIGNKTFTYGVDFNSEATLISAINGSTLLGVTATQNTTNSSVIVLTEAAGNNGLALSSNDATNLVPSAFTGGSTGTPEAYTLSIASAPVADGTLSVTVNGTTVPVVVTQFETPAAIATAIAAALNGNATFTASYTAAAATNTVVITQNAASSTPITATVTG